MMEQSNSDDSDKLTQKIVDYRNDSNTIETAAVIHVFYQEILKHTISQKKASFPSGHSSECHASVFFLRATIRRFSGVFLCKQPGYIS